MGTETGSVKDLFASSSTRSFSHVLSGFGLRLTRSETTTLQVNTGLLCNQLCKHCHLEAGPERTEVMGLETVEQVIDFARKTKFQVIDVTGGAPELNPNLTHMIAQFSVLATRIMLRTNLTALHACNNEALLGTIRDKRVVLVASLPSLNSGQLEAQRGTGNWEKSLAMLRQLNAMGYGKLDSGLELNLVCNPTGAFLPASQGPVEERFRSELEGKWGILFSHLYAFANVPLGRFRQWLIESGNFEKYMSKLVSAFNQCAVDKLMCRTLISVSWDGYLYDCDFNQAEGIPVGGVRTHISEVNAPPAPGTQIAVSDHCYACTAGPGFT
jgi:radical SAM/Cys-rich protein